MKSATSTQVGRHWRINFFIQCRTTSIFGGLSKQELLHYNLFEEFFLLFHFFYNKMFVIRGSLHSLACVWLSQ